MLFERHCIDKRRKGIRFVGQFLTDGFLYSLGDNTLLLGASGINGCRVGDNERLGLGLRLADDSLNSKQSRTRCYIVD